jgi:hypothetical protein
MPDSGWRGLAPIPTTLAPPAATVPLAEFTSSLSTSVNPGVVTPPAPVSIGRGSQLSVLRMTDESTHIDSPAPPTPGPVPQTRQSRRWSPRLPLQLTADESSPPPLRQLPSWPSRVDDVVEPSMSAGGLTHSSTESDDSQELRSVPVAAPSTAGVPVTVARSAEFDAPLEPTTDTRSLQHDAAQEPTVVEAQASDVAVPPVAAPVPPVAGAVTTTAPSVPDPTPMPTVARLPDTPQPSVTQPTVIEPSSPRPSPGPVQPSASTPPPAVVPIQRVVANAEPAHHEVVPAQQPLPTIPEPTAGPTGPTELAPQVPSTPVETTLEDSHTPGPPQDRPAVPVHVEAPMPLQRVAEAGLPPVHAIRPSVTNPVVQEPPSATPTRSDPNPATFSAPDPEVEAGIEPGVMPPASLPHSPEIVEASTLEDDPELTAQRHVDPAPQAPLPLPMKGLDVPSAPVVAAPVVYDTDRVATAPAPGPALTVSGPTPPQPVQRIDTQAVPPRQEHAREVRVTPAATPTSPGDVVADAAAPRPVAGFAVQRSPAEEPVASKTPGPASTVEAPSRQRISLPVVQPIQSDATVESASAVTSSSTVASTADVVPARGRVVLLPPVQRTTDGIEPIRPHRPSESTIAESARPMSLQRMFEQTARSADPTPEPARADASDHQRASQIVTFDSPVLQRDTDTDGDAALPTDETATAPAAAGLGPAPSAGAAPAGGSALPTNIDELVNRIYDPLAARLRAELWMDRERAGTLMNLHR